MSSKKELVVMGDSFCIDYINMRNLMHDNYNGGRYLLFDPDLDKVREFKWPQQKTFPIWGEIVAEELNLKLVTLGQSGTGTDFHFAGALDYIINNKENIEKVIISWSSFGRFDFETSASTKLYAHHPWPWRSVNGALLKFNKLMNNKTADDLLNAAREANALSFEVGINNFFRHAYVLQNLLESYGIDYHMIQSLHDAHAFPNKYDTLEGGYTEYAKHLLKNPYFDLIDDNKFIGWPGIKTLGGFTMVDLIWTKDNKNFISSMDKHPNENGMKIIAKTILDNLL